MGRNAIHVWINLKRILLFLSAVSLFLLSSCSASSPAPIVNGWQQAAAAKSIYIVQKGDTLYSIAWAFEMDFRDLARMNHIVPPYTLYAGQRLKMYPGAPEPAVTTAGLQPTDEFIPVRTTVKPHLPVPSTRQKQSQVAIFRPGTIKKLQSSAIVKGSRSVSQQFDGHWLWPAHGKVVRQFSTAPGGNHGIEIAGRLGASVVASAPGIVVYSGSGLRGYGKLIIIKHNDTYLSAYAYNQKLLVKEGAVIKAGQPIALMGSNNAGQVRLHFEIRRSGKPVNPLNYIKGVNRA